MDRIVGFFFFLFGGIVGFLQVNSATQRDKELIASFFKLFFFHVLILAK